MNYCKDALKLCLKGKVTCSNKCPVFQNCPLLILQNADLDADEIREKARPKAIKAMMEVIGENKNTKAN